MPRKAFKRLFDLVFASLALIALSPVLAAVAFALAITGGIPVLFRQERPGYKCRPFTLFKFRTMNDARDERGRLLPDGQRLGGLGKLLRSLSLDELPQLFNVLKGDMSLVGPRPLLPEYLSRYSSSQILRHDAMPGITGWAQINGRNSISWDERLELDLWYVRNQGFVLDLRILAVTVLKVLSRAGVRSAGHATMPEFRPPVAVIGAGGHAKVVIQALRELGYSIAGIYDDDPSLKGSRILGEIVVGPAALLEGQPDLRAVIAIGDNASRKVVSEKLSLRWITVIHPRATVDSSAEIGPGTVVLAGAVIQAQAKVGAHCIVNTAATVDHDCELGRFAHIAPGTHLAGGVQVGEGGFVGIGSSVVPGARLGAWSVLGAGSVVVRDIGEGQLAYGVPARSARPSLKSTRRNHG